MDAILFKLAFAALLLKAARQYVLEHTRPFGIEMLDHDPRNCWIGTTSGDGRYKHAWFLGQKFKLHVLSYLAFNGPLARHHVVDHDPCNNTACSNPHHLRAASQSQNMKRCFAEGRGRSPLINGESKSCSFS